MFGLVLTFKILKGFDNVNSETLFTTVGENNARIREDTLKKRFFLVVDPVRFYPPYTNGLVVHSCHSLFLRLKIALNGFCQFFFFFSIFGLK